MFLARYPGLVRLIPAGVLLACCLPTAAHASVATAPPPRPILTVPPALLRRAAVPVIVEMASPRPGGLALQAPLQALHAQARQPLMAALRVARARNVYAFRHVDAVAAMVPGSALSRLLHQPGVRAIVPDRWHSLAPQSAGASRVIQVPPTNEPQSLSLTRATAALASGYTGAGVRVALIDSGIDTALPDLAGTMATDAQGRPLAVDFTGTDLTDTIGHGTACASMIAAQGHVLYAQENRPLRQVYPPPSPDAPVYRSHFHVNGIAPAVTLMSAKVFDTRAPHDGGYDSWIVRAIEWAVDHHADVISESFGGLSVPGDGTDPVSLADEAAIAAGVTVVAANGNEGPGQSTVSSPANAPGVIAVGASTQYRQFGQSGFLARFGQTTADNVAAFTSRGPTTDGRPRPDLVAPGAFSWALFPAYKTDDGPAQPPYDVGPFGGTSEATPLTAGVAALVIDAFRRAHHGVSPSPALVRSILMSSAHDLGYPAYDQGAGRLDAWMAVQTAVHSGPSFLLTPNSLAVSGPRAAPFTTTIAITNTGSAAQTYRFDATQSHLTGFHTWVGVVEGTQLQAYHIDVPAGLERIAGAVYWNSADRYPVLGTDGAVALRVALYDPLGRFVNYAYGLGSGYAEAEVSRPMPGTWTVVISQNGRLDAAGIRRYTSEQYRASFSTYVSVPYGRFSPRVVTIAPGRAAHVALTGRIPARAGTQVVTVRVHGDHTVALPLAITSYLTLNGPNTAFSGAFTGASTAYISLSNENKVYALNVPPRTSALKVVLSWPDTGYGVVVLLMDPSGEIVDGQFNGVSTGDPLLPYDLSAHNLALTWSAPVPGRWQIIVMDAVFAGQQQAEPFSGRVTLNTASVTPAALTRTVAAGGSINLNLMVRNDNGPNVTEGYVGYATGNSYSNLPLGGVSSPFGDPNDLAGSDVYTYTTGFVPPGTRMVTSAVAVIRPSVTADLSLADPIGFSRSEGESAAVTIAGHRYQGTRSVVRGAELPIGSWSAEVTLRRPFDTHTHAMVVAESYANALTPLPWIAFHPGLSSDGTIVGGLPLTLLPGQEGVLQASVAVPATLHPGTYQAHLFVISTSGDQVADIPLTLAVTAGKGGKPGK